MIRAQPAGQQLLGLLHGRLVLPLPQLLLLRLARWPQAFDEPDPDRVAVRPVPVRRVVGARYDRTPRAERGQRPDEQPDPQPTRLDLWQPAPDLRAATAATAAPVPD